MPNTQDIVQKLSGLCDGRTNNVFDGTLESVLGELADEVWNAG